MKAQRARVLRRQQTPPEEMAWEFLRSRRIHGLKFRRQQVIRGFIVDFYCAERRLVLELDGAVHDGEDARASDSERSRVLANLGIRVVRIQNDELSVERLERILAAE